MASYTVDPIRMFESNGGVTQIITVPVTAAIALNQVVYTGVADHRIRVMGWRAHSNTAAIAPWVIKTGSGVFLTGPNWAPVNTAPTDFLPIVECGYAETELAEDLLLDVAVSQVNFTFFLIVYRPGPI